MDMFESFGDVLSPNPNISTEETTKMYITCPVCGEIDTAMIENSCLTKKEIETRELDISVPCHDCQNLHPQNIRCFL